jgi:hypothetical protein
MMAGTAATALARLGFGVRAIDLDADGVMDFVVANGHIYPNGSELKPPVEFAQPPTLWLGTGQGRFADATERAGVAFSRPMVARGLATGDLDGDGDLDFVFTANDGPSRILERTGGPRGRWIMVRLKQGRGRDLAAVGARVTVVSGGRSRSAMVRSGGSFLSQSDFGLHFGLGDASSIERVIVRWPDGTEQQVEGARPDSVLEVTRE